METGFAKKLSDSGIKIYVYLADFDHILDQEVRDKALLTLKRWIKSEGNALPYEEFLKLWKGLFYSVWMADKPKYQNELSDNLAYLATTLSCEFPEVPEGKEPDLEDFPAALRFIRAFWETMCREWRGIDRLRLNKYYYLMGQFLKMGFEIIRAADFDREFTCLYFGVLQDFPMNMNNDKVPAAIKIYVVENYVSFLRGLEEYFDESLTLIMMSPLLEAVACASDKILRKTLKEAFEKIVQTHEALEDAIGMEDAKDGEVSMEEDEQESEDQSDVSGQSEEEEEEDESADPLALGLLSHTLFEMGAEPEVKDANRKILYELSELFKPYEVDLDDEEMMCCSPDGACCGHDECSDDEECCGEECCSHDHDHDESDMEDASQ